MQVGSRAHLYTYVRGTRRIETLHFKEHRTLAIFSRGFGYDLKYVFVFGSTESNPRQEANSGLTHDASADVFNEDSAELLPFSKYLCPWS